MAKNPKVPVAVMDAGLDAMIGNPSDSGSIVIYDGIQPANGGDPLTGQTALCTFPLPADAFPLSSGKVLTANPIDEALAVAGGSPRWFRIYKADGVTPLVDGTAGNGTSYDCQLTRSIFVLGQSQKVIVCTFTGNN